MRFFCVLLCIQYRVAIFTVARVDVFAVQLNLIWMFEMKTTTYTTCLITLILSGCCPVIYSVYPGFSGRVVYTDSRYPVSGATAQLKKIRCYLKPDSNQTFTNVVTVASVTTDSNGFFRIKSPKRLGIYIMPMDVFPGLYQLELNDKNRVFWSSEYLHRCLWDKHFYDLGDMKLEQSPSGNGVTAMPEKWRSPQKNGTDFLGSLTVILSVGRGGRANGRRRGNEGRFRLLNGYSGWRKFLACR